MKRGVDMSESIDSKLMLLKGFTFDGDTGRTINDLYNAVSGTGCIKDTPFVMPLWLEGCERPAGVNSFITKPAISVANSAFLWFLGRYNYNFDGLAGTQSAQAETGILMGWELIPGVLLAISFASLFLYPLAGDAWEKIKNQIALVHVEKEKKMLAEKGIKYEG